jgi:histidyl-tRNA synthetase
VVRAAIQEGSTNGNLKVAYWGPMFRYERPQQGRTRQFYQGGVEYLGSESAEADVEVIEFGYRYLESMNVPDVEVRLNSIGDPDDRALYRDEIAGFLRSRFDQLSPDAQRRIETNPMRVLDSKADVDVVKDAPVPIDHLGPAAQEHFADVRSGLESLGIPYAIDNKLVRGLDYYNRSVWEYVPLGYGAAQSAAGGGGRYDGLFELLGGSPTPGVGLAMGVDRILLASDGLDLADRLDLFVVVADDELRTEGRILTSQLRSAGLRVDMTDAQRSVKSQFKAADRSGATAAVVVGEELESGNVTVRHLESGDQEEIPLKEIAQWLQGR